MQVVKDEYSHGIVEQLRGIELDGPCGNFLDVFDELVSDEQLLKYVKEWDLLVEVYQARSAAAYELLKARKANKYKAAEAA